MRLGQIMNTCQNTRGQQYASRWQEQGTMYDPCTRSVAAWRGRPPKPPLCWDPYLHLLSPHLKETAHPPAALHSGSEQEYLLFLFPPAAATNTNKALPNSFSDL